MSSNQARVTVTELAAALGYPPDQWPAETAAGLGITAVPDWAGRPSLTVDEARRLVDHIRTERDTGDRAWEQYKAACAQWTANRSAVMREAYREPWEKAKAARRNNGSADEYGRAAARAAGRDYERTVPRPAYRGKIGYGNVARLEFLHDDELTPVVGRIREAARVRAEKREPVPVTEGVA